MYFQKNGNKYHAKTSVYKGNYYASQLEAAYARELDLRLAAKEIVKWDKQVRIPIAVNGYLITTYIIDFVVFYPDGTREYVETKGYETDVWRIKAKIFEATFIHNDPNARYLVVKKSGIRTSVLKKKKMA